MQATVHVTLAALLTLIFAGCTYQPEARVVDFSAVDASQPNAGFELQVKVIGMADASMPLVGAFVGVAEGTQAVAKSTTGVDGIATLRLQRDQTVRVVASAPGWTTEDSGKIRIGRPSSNADFDNAQGMVSCSGGAAQSSDGQSAGGWCTVTSGSDDSSSYTLDGDKGAVSVVLFPRQVKQTFTEEIGPNANAFLVTAPNGERWLPFHRPVQGDPVFHDLQMLRFENATTTMTWENAMLSQADFEIGVGCTESEPDAQSDDDLPKIRQQTRNEVEVAFDAQDDGRWSSCGKFFVGPVVDSVNLPVTVTIENVMTFRGRSTIIPIGD